MTDILSTTTVDAVSHSGDRHGEQVLSSLGLTSEDIIEMRAARVLL
jgi:hypothetical protein